MLYAHALLLGTMMHSVIACTELESIKGNSTRDYTTTFMHRFVHLAIIETAELDRECMCRLVVVDAMV